MWGERTAAIQSGAARSRRRIGRSPSLTVQVEMPFEDLVQPDGLQRHPRPHAGSSPRSPASSSASTLTRRRWPGSGCNRAARSPTRASVRSFGPAISWVPAERRTRRWRLAICFLAIWPAWIGRRSWIGMGKGRTVLGLVLGALSGLIGILLDAGSFLAEAVRSIAMAATERHGLRVDAAPARRGSAFPRRTRCSASMPAFLASRGARPRSQFAVSAQSGLPDASGPLSAVSMRTTGHRSRSMDGTYVTATRTAAASALATRYLARERCDVC